MLVDREVLIKDIVVHPNPARFAFSQPNRWTRVTPIDHNGSARLTINGDVLRCRPKDMVWRKVAVVYTTISVRQREPARQDW